MIPELGRPDPPMAVVVGAGARGLDHAALFLASTERARLVFCGAPLRGSVFDPARSGDYRGANVPTSLVDRVTDKHIGMGMNSFVERMRDDPEWKALRNAKPDRMLSHAEIGAAARKRFDDNAPKDRIEIAPEATDIRFDGDDGVAVETADGRTLLARRLYLTAGAVADPNKPWLGGTDHPGLIHVSMAIGAREEARLRELSTGEDARAVIVGGGPVACDALVALDRAGFAGEIVHVSGRAAPPDGLPDMDFDRTEIDRLRNAVEKADITFVHGEATVAVGPDRGFEATIRDEEGAQRTIAVDQVVKPYNAKDVAEDVREHRDYFTTTDFFSKKSKSSMENEVMDKISRSGRSLLIQSDLASNWVSSAFGWLCALRENNFIGPVMFVAPRSLEIEAGFAASRVWKEQRAKFPRFEHIRDRAEKLFVEDGTRPLKIDLRSGTRIEADIVMNCSGSLVMPSIYRKAQASGILRRDENGALIPARSFIAISDNAGKSGAANPRLRFYDKVGGFDPADYLEFAASIETDPRP